MPGQALEESHHLALSSPVNAAVFSLALVGIGGGGIVRGEVVDQERGFLDGDGVEGGRLELGGRAADVSVDRGIRLGAAVEVFELAEEAVALAVLSAGAAVLGALVVLLDVLEFLFAFLRVPLVPQFGQFPAHQCENFVNSDPLEREKERSE